MATYAGNSHDAHIRALGEMCDALNRRINALQQNVLTNQRRLNDVIQRQWDELTESFYRDPSAHIPLTGRLYAVYEMCAAISNVSQKLIGYTLTTPERKELQSQIDELQQALNRRPEAR